MTDDSATFIDQQVAEGSFASRADYLSWLEAKEAMRQRTTADLATLSDHDEHGYREFDALHDYVSAHPPELP